VQGQEKTAYQTHMLHIYYTAVCKHATLE